MLYRGGKFNDILKGTVKADQFFGYEDNDTFFGMGGDDDFDGGTGVNTVDYSWAKLAVTVNLNLTGFQATGGAGSNRLINIQNLIGTAAKDRFTGNSANNSLTGGAGDDWLSGEGGKDVLLGGDGYDQLYGGDGNDLLDGGNWADQLFGGAGADELWGGAGDDILDGGDGNDRLIGGGGFDKFIGGAGDDYLLGTGGADTFVGGAGADQHLGMGGDDVVTYAGSTAAVRLDLRTANGSASTGDALLDTFTGIGQFDLTAFNDVYYAAQLGGTAQIVMAGAGNDSLYGYALAEALFGGAGDDLLSGERGVDRLSGGDGADVIIGGGDGDQLYGGAGADRFVYQSIADSRANGIDRIYDFTKGDLLDLQAIDANSLLAGDQAFKQVAAFTKAAGQLVLSYDATAKLSTVQLDVNGDGLADARILIDGRPEAGGTWLVL